MNLLWRVALIMLLGAWIVWPDWFGLSVLLVNLFPTMPVLATLLGLAVLLVVVTLLPLSLRLYKRCSQLGLILAVAVTLYKANTIGFLTFDMPMTWMIIIALSVVFIFIAWPMKL